MSTESTVKHTKATALAAWRALQPGQPILPHMSAIPYKSRGSRYGACGIRVDGNPEFINAVLSRLQDVIAGENHCTRLELARHVVDGNGLDKSFDNADRNAEVCYIRLHERGREGMIGSAIFDRHLDGNQAAFDAVMAKGYQ